MTAEKKKVLDLLAAGKITSEDAEKLLDKLDPSGSESGKTKDSAEEGHAASARKPRYLRIEVDRPGGDQVNMRVPLAFVRTGTGLLGVLPARVSEKLRESGIDFAGLAALKSEDLDETLRELNMTIDRSNGKKVRIFCE